MHIETIVVGPVATNCYIVSDEAGAAAVIDPGDSPARILREISRLGLDLKYIFLTHGHFDHILAVPEIKAETGAKVVIHRLDANRLSSGEASLATAVRREHAPITPDETAEDGSEYTAGSLKFTYVHTPGHTEGSSVILCENRMFSGDTLFSGDCGRCDLPGGSYDEMLRSLKKLHDLPNDYTVLPGHEGKTTLQTERERNSYMREGVSKAENRG